MPINTLDPDESQDLLGHFIGRVEGSFWSTPYVEAANDNKPDWEGADVPRLYWHVRVLDVLQPDYDGNIPETVTLTWTIGKGWWVSENGEQVRHKEDASDEEIENGSAKPHTFKVNTGLGRWLNLIKGGVGRYETEMGPAVLLDGSGDVDYGLYPDVRDYLVANDLVDSRDAGIWRGMVFEFRGLGLKYGSFGKDRDVPTTPRMRPYPVKYLGVGDGVGAGVTQTPNSIAGALDIPARDVQTWRNIGASEDTATVLAKLAVAASSHTEFQRNALLVPSVKEDDSLSNAVMDEGVWSQ